MDMLKRSLKHTHPVNLRIIKLFIFFVCRLRGLKIKIR